MGDETIKGIEKWSDKAIDMIMQYGPKILLAIIVLIVGFIIVNSLVKLTRKIMNKRKADKSLQAFVLSLINIGLKALVLISVADMIGIETTSFVAIIGAAGLAVGLALQGTLANFAGGVLVLVFKPYKVGDLIEAQDNIGTVKDIQIFVTILLTFENKTVIIPNGAISNGNITNYTTEGKIRVDMIFGISYTSDIKAARKALTEVMTNHPKVFKEPAPFVGVESLGDSSVNLVVRPYCHPKDYWEVYFYVYENGKEALDNTGIEIPFPQMDVHMNK